MHFQIYCLGGEGLHMYVYVYCIGNSAHPNQQFRCIIAELAPVGWPNVDD